MLGRVSLGVLPVVFVLSVPGPGAAQPGQPGGSDRPSVTAVPKRAVRAGDPVVVGGPGSCNFLGNVWMDVYVVPHRAWFDGDPLGAGAAARARVLSDGDGTIPPFTVWVANQVGVYDVVVDYDNDGRFCSRLDAVCAIQVLPGAVAGPEAPMGQKEVAAGAEPAAAPVNPNRPPVGLGALVCLVSLIWAVIGSTSGAAPNGSGGSVATRPSRSTPSPDEEPV